MKKVIALTISGLLCACGDIPDDTSDNLKRSSSDTIISLGDSEGHGSPCDRREVQHITVDGQSYVFNVPALCNPYLGIDKGDPPPDRQRHSWDDKENSFNAPHVDVGSQNSPAQ